MENLSALIEDFVYSRGEFSGVRISPRQRIGYKKHGIVPMEFLEWLKGRGFPDVIEVFKKINRFDRSAFVVAEYVENRAWLYGLAYADATAKQLGNLRYKMSDSRPSPQTILVNMVDHLRRLQDRYRS